MAKVSEVVAILKKQSDLIGKLRSEKADLLAALKWALPWAEDAIRALKVGDGDDRDLLSDGPRGRLAQARAAIEKAS